MRTLREREGNFGYKWVDRYCCLFFVLVSVYVFFSSVAGDGEGTVRKREESSRVVLSVVHQGSLAAQRRTLEITA